MTGAVLDEASRVHVADAQALEVRVFSPAGEFLFRYGRAGEGPGEFRNISGIGRDGAGGVAVLDGSLGRVSRFDAEGEYRESFRLERAYMIHGYNAPVRFDAEGRFHDRVQLSTRIDEPERIAWVRYSPSGTPDTIQVAEFEPARYVVHNEHGMPAMSMPLPFAPRAATAMAPDGSSYVTRGAEYRIIRLSPEGDTVRVIRREIEPAAVSAGERDEAVERMAERIRRATGTEPRNLPALPDRHPALLALVVDEAGHLWAARPSGNAFGEWDVFDEDGVLLGSAETGDLAVLHIAEAAVVGVVRDEFDVERVRVVPLRR